MKNKEFPFVVIFQIGIADVEHKFATSEEEAHNIVDELKKRRCFTFANIYKLM